MPARCKDSNGALWNWHEAVRKGDLDSARRDVTLTVVNGEGQAIAKYLMERGWPLKLKITAMGAGKSEVVLEELTLIAEYVRRIAP